MKIIKKIFCKKNIPWIALLLLFLLLFIFFSFRKGIDEVRIESHKLYQYFSGIKVEYTGKIRMKRSNDNITKISFTDETVDLDSTPIYYQQAKKVIFPKNMSSVFPTLGKQYKVNYYSTLSQDGDTIYVMDRDLKRTLSNALLYDGNDLYFFVDAVTVTYGDVSVDLEPLSYITVDPFNHLLQIYDYANDSFTMISDTFDEVFISTKKYKVNASLDVMYYNKKSRLLFKDISKLNNLSDR